MFSFNKYERTKKLWQTKHRSDAYAFGENSDKNNKLSEAFIRRHLTAIQNADSLLELGMGSGRNINILLQHMPKTKYFGNDISPNVITYIREAYPNVFANCEITVKDTRSYVSHSPNVDVVFTHGHLMHLPENIIREVCANISKIANHHILIREAFTNDVGVGFFRSMKYKRYRFDRDYSDMFPHFKLVDKVVTKHPKKKWVRQGEYLFSR